MSSGFHPASVYERSMNFASASVSIRCSDEYGVRMTSDRWMTFRSTTTYALERRMP
jgi:hypothetical protein